MQRLLPQIFAVLIILAMHLPLAVADGYSRNPRLVGHWTYKGPEASSILIISKDGTWSGTVTLPDQPEAQFEGKWLTDEEHIYWLYTKSSSPKVKPGGRDKDKLVEITEDFFVVDTRSNRRVKYIRVK
jgi:hypothetical protein